MKPTLRPLSLTIVDILGTFLPGVAWFLLFLLFFELIFGNNFGPDFSPLGVIQGYIMKIHTEQTMRLVIIIILSSIAGYISKPFSMTIAERLSVIFSFKTISKIKNKSLKSYLFPYPAIFEDKAYFIEITNIVKQHSGVSYENLPGSEPFTFCKRFLKVISPELWEESERLEAEVRMLGSFFLVCFFSTSLSIFFALFKDISGKLFSEWVVISGLLTLFLSIGFRKRRQKEVAYTYLNTIIGVAGFKIKMANGAPETLET
jgi:hypothetical protein